MDEACPQCFHIISYISARPSHDDEARETPLQSTWKLPPKPCGFCELLDFAISNSQTTSSCVQKTTLRTVHTSNELHLYVDGPDAGARLEYNIRECQPPSDLPCNGPPQLPKGFDIKALKTRLDRCERHDCLKEDLMPITELPRLRFVDVWKNCVVQLEELGYPVKYIALSYVWGDVSQPSLKSEEALRPDGSLLNLDPPLPRTIQEAMALCRALDIDYLWVDTLCIIQSWEADKNLQICSMADIYYQSYLTICAAAGDDANASLGPYPTGHRDLDLSYLVRNISNRSFVAYFRPEVAAKELALSKWASRGWTLQEYALSRRNLFLTRSYAFLRCEKSLWCEDFGLGFSECFKDGVATWDLPLTPFYRRTESHSRHYPSNFSRMLGQYVRRDRRLDSDVLDAFAGILTREDKNIGGNLWGNPKKQFGAALQWVTNLSCPSTERLGFPTWAWTGWVHYHDFSPPNGLFHDMYEGLDHQAIDMSAVTCYDIDDDQRPRLVEECDISHILSRMQQETRTHPCSENVQSLMQLNRLQAELRQSFTPPPSPPVLEIQSYLNFQHPSRPPPSHHIFLWASCASLYVNRTPTNQEGPTTWEYRVRVKKDSEAIASINLTPGWREQQEDYMDFFVSTIGVHPHPEVVEPLLRTTFKVILIIPYYQLEPPVYKRIQVAHTNICIRHWMDVDFKSSLIALA